MDPEGDAFDDPQQAMVPEKNPAEAESFEFVSIVLLERYRAGDEQAAALLYRLYTARLIALARSHLSPRLGTRFDPEDVVQSAYRSFFIKAREGRYFLERSGDLWRLLAAITRHKLARQIRHHLAEKRSVDREACEFADLPCISEESDSGSFAELHEVLREAMLPMSAFERRVLELRLRGSSLSQISNHTGRSERTVRRTLDRIRNDLSRRLDDDQE